MIQIQYFIRTGRKLNLKNPKRFSEKLNWYKLYWRTPEMKQCVDKYDVREFVKAKGCEDLLNECYGVYDRFEDIDFAKLPNRFVIKDTLGGGGSSVVIVKDKNQLDMTKLKHQTEGWISIKGKNAGRAWFYENKHRIIIEKFIDSSDNIYGLIDYKFFCFNGKAKFMYVITERKLGAGAKFGIFDMNYLRYPVRRNDERVMTDEPPRPSNFDDMIKIAEKLSEGFPEVRVDLYDVKGKIIFGELTFFDGSGYMKFEPDEYDFKFGDFFVLPPKRDYNS
jgi:hypothetical protein